MDDAKFKLRMRGANTFMPPVEQPATGICLDVMVWNVGEPSAIVAWELTVTPPGKAPMKTQAASIPIPILTLKNGDGLPPTIIDGTKDLANFFGDIDRKVLSGPVLFYVKMPMPDVLNLDTHLSLSIEDVFEKKTVFEQSMRDWLRLTPT